MMTDAQAEQIGIITIGLQKIAERGMKEKSRTVSVQDVEIKVIVDALDELTDLMLFTDKDRETAEQESRFFN